MLHPEKSDPESLVFVEFLPPRAPCRQLLRNPTRILPRLFSHADSAAVEHGFIRRMGMMCTSFHVDCFPKNGALVPVFTGGFNCVKYQDCLCVTNNCSITTGDQTSTVTVERPG